MAGVRGERARRKALIDAVILEVAEHGTVDVPVAQIARRAGMSSALAHHYFGSKEQIFALAMQHVLTRYSAKVRARLKAATTPRARLDAIVLASFEPDQFRPDVVTAWLNFYVQAQHSAPARRLLRIYQARLRSNLMHALRPLAGMRAAALTQSVAAMIDGLYLHQTLSGQPDSGAEAARLVMQFLDTSLITRGRA